MNRFPRLFTLSSLSAVVLCMVLALTALPGQTQQAAGAMVLSQRYVETPDGLVWTVFTIEDGDRTFQGAIEGGVNSEGVRLEVSGWPHISVGERYEFTTGKPLPSLNAIEVVDAEAQSSHGGGDADPGYTLGPAHWGKAAKNLTWHANQSTFPPLDSQQVISALSDGLTAWTTQPGSSSLSFTYGGNTSVATNAFDGVNAMYWADTTQDEHYLARTYLWFTDPDNDPSTPGGAVEFDIKYNNDYLWSNGAKSGHYDLKSVAIHESGHAIGLSHASTRANVMFPSLVVGSAKHTLGQGDIDGANLLYGTSNDPVTTTKTYKCKGKVATIVGTAANDVLNGTDGRDIIVGLGGDDLINGGGGNDVICSGSGADRVDGGNGRDKIVGGTGNDVLIGGGGRDFLSGGGGSDELYGGKKNDTLKGGGAGDKLYGEGGDDTLKAGGGADLLVGGAGVDTLLGGPGKDVLSTDAADTSDGGTGTDKCTAAGSRTSCELTL